MKLAFVFFLLSLSWPSAGGAETSKPEVRHTEKPTYRWRSPQVLFDEGHHNVHTLGTGYRAFAEVLERDGYRLLPIREPFSVDKFGKAKVLVVVNPRGAGPEAPLPQRGRPAFTREERAAVERWVRGGGSLLLIADHYPIGSATQPLAEAFGIDMSNAFTLDPEQTLAGFPGDATLSFRRDRKGVNDHPITRGRNANERIDVVHTFTGQSLRGPEGSTPLLLLSARAEDALPADRTGKVASAAGRSQGLALSHGKGRVVVLAEAQALTSISDKDGATTGFGYPGNDNRQLILNIMRWLTGKI